MVICHFQSADEVRRMLVMRFIVSTHRVGVLHRTLAPLPQSYRIKMTPASTVCIKLSSQLELLRFKSRVNHTSWCSHLVNTFCITTTKTESKCPHIGYCTLTTSCLKLDRVHSCTEEKTISCEQTQIKCPSGCFTQRVYQQRSAICVDIGLNSKRNSQYRPIS